MLSTEPIQHIRHSCEPEEFESYLTGEKTFDIKLNDPNFRLSPGDLITIEEIDKETGKPTGQKFTRKIGFVLNTKAIGNITTEEVAQRGITICSLIQPEYGSLYALYSKYFSMSLVIDRQNDVELTVQKQKNWDVFGNVAYTPMGVCPDFVELGILNSFSIDKWPEGRYYLTVLIHVDEGHEVNVKDVIVLSMAYEEKNVEDADFVELALEPLFAGTAITQHTNKKVTLLSVDDAHAATAVPMSPNATADYDDILSETEMKKLIEEAKLRGEQNLHLLTGDPNDEV